MPTAKHVGVVLTTAFTHVNYIFTVRHPWIKKQKKKKKKESGRMLMKNQRFISLVDYDFSLVTDEKTSEFVELRR
jgi:hypothetical protein